MACKAVQRFGETPKVALLSHSNFGSADSVTARKMGEASRILR
jgi:malate dehydrogenase (oxaloacetate-decarboxylating)(NADP+)